MVPVSVKFSEVPGLLNDEETFSFFGFDLWLLPGGRVYANEWVHDESPGVTQVHSDDGRDYIVEGDPTLGMLYDSVERFVTEAGDGLLERLQETLEEKVPA